MTAPTMPHQAGHRDSVKAQRLKRRHRAEARFRLYGIVAVMLALTALVVLLGTIVRDGSSALVTSEMRLEVFMDPAVIDPEKSGKPDDWRQANYSVIVLKALQKIVPEATGRVDLLRLLKLASSGARDVLRERVLSDSSVIGKTIIVAVPTSDDVGLYRKGKISQGDGGLLNARQIAWIEKMEAAGVIYTTFNMRFFASGASREPELAGIWSAIVGSALTLSVTLLLAFPLGVAAAIYLQEFAPKNKWTDVLEVNINNLAAVPSIVFGLLGLAVFLGVFGLPRSAPLVGGMVLALMTLPTIIIASRTAMQSVPPSIREAAIGLGASPLQVAAHHVLPLAMPGILTGSIIGMSRALGETAPLLMIGMVAFIVDAPTSPMDPATVLPVQVFLWADSPERAFAEKTAAAVMVLLVFLILMNGLAIFLRKKFERRW
ncbi:MAG: phosphate transport system permease protein [Alphaproteobacteria bacterium]|jgi:phosphate transport system permease protein